MPLPALFSQQPFSPPSWMAAIRPEALPSSRVVLARLPTPTHPLLPFRSRFVEEGTLGKDGVEIHVKRDDLTSFDMSGNKVRKLEFLLADALEGRYDSVITIGGIQSNHCRATAVAARQLGLVPILILRTELSPDEIDLNGNLLLSRMAGAKIYTVKPDDYYEKGGDFFVHQLAERLLIEQGRKCYEIPCGGSNVLGTFGYLNAVTEMLEEFCPESTVWNFEQGPRPFPYQHVVFGCGSGGTAAGLAIGAHLAQINVQIHAISVCDTPEDFFEMIRLTALSLGLTNESDNSNSDRPPLYNEVREWIDVYDGQGLGYSISSNDELEFLHEISAQTGLTFDPVYSGKALYTLCTKMIKTQPNKFKPGDKVLFIHTGGALGCYAKEDQLLPVVTSYAKDIHHIEPL